MLRVLSLESEADRCSLSYMEMRLIIGKLLWHNDIEMASHPANDVWDPKNDHENMVVYNNWIKPPLYVKLTPRRV